MFKKKLIFYLLLAILPLGTTLIYFATSAGNTPYNYFTRLAIVFLQGKYWLSENPAWLSELIPAGVGKFYVPYPPMPAILALPFVFLFGKNIPQQYIAHLVGGGIAFLTTVLSWKVKRDIKLAIWSGFLISVGTIVWFLSATGSAWYLGQTTATFFLLAALVTSLDKKSPLLTGIFLGCAYLSRIHTIISLPLFIYLLAPSLHLKVNLKTYLQLFIGLLPALLFNALYNYVRFGVFWDIGYALIPGVLKEPWYAHGIISPHYIPDNLKVAFLSLPKIIEKFPYIIPSWGGLALWITTPAFIFSLTAPLKKMGVKLSWLAVFGIALFVFSHGTTGFAQFGYRFAVDFYPFLIFLTIKGVAHTGLKWYHWLFLLAGVVVNLWGVLWINKFGWVGF